MTAPRPDISNDLERSLFIEAGYRCAVCKETDPLQIDHIVEWAKVQVHEFENMIVLCANCHGRKKDTSHPRHINRASLKKIKSNLMLLNGRYSDLERRIIDNFREKGATVGLSVFIPERLFLLVKFLIKDGIVSVHIYQSAMQMTFDDGATVLRDDTLKLTLTDKGHTFIKELDTV
jgi:hypothetical protein